MKVWFAEITAGVLFISEGENSPDITLSDVIECLMKDFEQTGEDPVLQVKIREIKEAKEIPMDWRGTCPWSTPENLCELYFDTDDLMTEDILEKLKKTPKRTNKQNKLTRDKRVSIQPHESKKKTK